MIFSVRLPLPPSINEMYITIKKGSTATGSRRRLSPMALAWQREARPIIRAQLKLTPWENGWDSYKLRLMLWFATEQQLRSSDWDGRIKLAQDTLFKLLEIDDSLIYDGQAIKCGVAMFDPFVDVIISPHERNSHDCY